MSRFTESKHSFKLSLNAIEARFGKGNFDDCAEEIQHIIYQIFASSHFKFAVDFDTTNSNPYFHVLCCEVKGIDSVTAGLVKNDLIKQGLIY